MEHLSELFLTLFWFIVTISIVVFLHEFGHFFFARKFGVKVEVFSIGFGRELIGWYDNFGTRWKISAIPLGGYVKMFGDANPASSPDIAKIEQMSEEDKKLSFYFKPLWQKAIIVGAGPLANYLTAIIIFTGMFFAIGKIVISPEVGSVVEGSAADRVGIKSGDIILKVDGEKVDNFNQIREALMLNTGTPVEIEFERGSKKYVASVTPQMKEVPGKTGAKIPLIGLGAKSVAHENLNLFESIYEATKQTYTISVGMLKGIWQMLSGQRGTEEIGGPVKIATFSKESAESGVLGILWFIALISINLGLFNLFPVPLLDGGHLLYYVIEAVKGRPMSDNLQSFGFKVGMAIIAALMLFAMYNDLKFLFFR